MLPVTHTFLEDFYSPSFFTRPQQVLPVQMTGRRISTYKAMLQKQKAMVYCKCKLKHNALEQKH